MKVTLAQVDWSGELEWDMLRLASDDSDGTVTELQSLVNKYDSRKQGIWNGVRLLMRKVKFEKHLGIIEREKRCVQDSKTNLSL
jgi:hypothetical protein